MINTVSLPILEKLVKLKPNFPEDRKHIPENRILARIGLNKSNTNIIHEY